MANTNYIMAQERAIIDAKNTVRSVAKSYLYELGRDDNHPLPANRDCWGTLHCNLLALREAVNLALVHMAPEFATDHDYRNPAPL